MGLILDTSVLIAAEKGRLNIQKLFAAHEGEPFHIAAITAAELLHGVARALPSARRRQRSLYVEAVISQLEPIDFDLSAARRHAEAWAALEKKGEMIGPYDLLIAATALHHGHAVVTLNLGEFRRVPGLRVVDPTRFVAA
jgi:predicted nucleic acid-binding protein